MGGVQIASIMIRCIRQQYTLSALLHLIQLNNEYQVAAEIDGMYAYCCAMSRQEKHLKIENKYTVDHAKSNTQEKVGETTQYRV